LLKASLKADRGARRATEVDVNAVRAELTLKLERLTELRTHARNNARSGELSHTRA
jgi:hypothetical protein